MSICIITLVLLSVFGIIANLSVIACIVKNASIRKSRNYLLIVSMTVADFFFLLIVATQDLMRKYSKLSSSLQLSANLTEDEKDGIRIASIGDSAPVRNILFRLFHYAAVASLVALNSDKFYYISAPFRYERLVTRTRLCLLIVFIWSFALVWTLFEHFRSLFLDESKMMFMCEVFAPIVCFILPIMTSFMLSVGIFRIALRHTTALYRLAREVNPIQSVERSMIYCRKLWRAILFVLITTLVSALLLLPYWVAKPILYFTHARISSYPWLAVFNDFLSINAAVDPLITILTQKLYRNEVKSWLLCLRTKVSKLAGGGGDNSSEDVIFPRDVKHEPSDEEMTGNSGASIESLDINKVLCELNRPRPFSMYDKRCARSMRSPRIARIARQMRSHSNPIASFDHGSYNSQPLESFSCNNPPHLLEFSDTSSAQ